jgi:arylformamidase
VKISLPRNVFKGALLGNGMYDLKPVRMSARSSYVKFTDEMEQALSVMRHIEKVQTPVVLAIGLLETPEFQRQSRDFAAALGRAGKPAQLIEAKGHNHYEIGESLGNPYGIMGRAALEMMGLATI